MAVLKERFDTGQISFEAFEVRAHKLNAEMAVLGPAVDQAREAQRLASAQTLAHTAEVERLTRGTLLLRDATDKTRQAIYQYTDALFGTSDAQVNYRQAQEAIKKAEEDLQNVLADPNHTAQQAEDAQNAVTDAQLHGAESAAALEAKNDELYNKIKTGGQDAYDSEVSRLNGLKAKYPDQAAIYQDQIDKLNIIWWTVTHSPDYKTVTVTAYTDQAQIALNTLKQQAEDLVAQTYIMTVDAYGLPP